MTWSVSQMPDLAGKTILVTGATSGVGLEASQQFVKKGAKLIMACRNEEKMAAVAASFKADTPNAHIVEAQVDIANLRSVRAFAEIFKKSGIAQLDVLLLNAAIVGGKPATSPQGYDLTYATNHLGHWLLTGLLLDYIKDVPGSRIVVVTSMGHHSVKSVNYDVMSGKKEASMAPYFPTKLANLLFVTELSRRLEQAGAQTVAVACHPGAARTNILASYDGYWILQELGKIFFFCTQPAEQGAIPLVMACVDPEVSSGNFYGPSGFLNLAGPPISNAKASDVAKDPEEARKLWRVTEELTAFVYNF